MPTLNKVFLLGNLTRDPDLRGLPSGQSVCEMRMAITRRYISNGQEVNETCYVDVVVWGKSANNCKQFLTKGSQIMVEGRLQLDQWEDRNGGGQRSKLRVVAEQVQFMNRRPAEGGAGSGYPAGPREGGSYEGYPPREGGYPPREGGYPPVRDGYAGRPRDNEGSYGRSDGGYGSYGRSVNPPPPEEAMPPVPDQEGDQDGNGSVDDIPF